MKHYYDKINPNFTFREEPNAVVAEFNPVSPGFSVGPVDVSEYNQPAKPTKGRAETARTLLDVIGGGVEGDKEGFEEIYFPNAVLQVEDQESLWTWTETTEWGIIDHQEKGLTLTKSKEFEDFLWRPEG